MSSCASVEELLFADELLVHCTEEALVRGREQAMLAQLLPLVAANNVVLSLEQVQKIDAAGLGALVLLYGEARKVRRSFRLIKPSRIVKGLIRIVGLELVLSSHNVNQESQSGPLAA